MRRRTQGKDSVQLRIYLLGRFQIQQGTTPVQLPTRKAESLLAYLLLHPTSHGREKLAALFWGDSSDRESRNSLRNALAVLNKKLGHDLLIIDRQSVSINPDYPLWVDVREFETLAAAFLSDPGIQPYQVLTALYPSDLLSDFYDEWIFPLREHYRSLFLKTLLHLTQLLRSQSDYEKAIEVARKVLVLDPANERAHQHVIFCHAALGDRSTAIKQYEECQRLMLEELGVEPAAETVSLYEWIKQASAEANPLEARITNLPIPLTNFIGRKRELNELKQELSSSRLLTIMGPGGSGKTRLAIQLGTDLLESFKDGVWWVDLASLTDKTLIPYSIAKSLGVSESIGQSLHDTLVNFLGSRHLLLILDNCEHLIEPCAYMANFLMEQCDQLKILATSRESLNVTGEHIWHVPALSLPDPQHLSMLDLLLEYEGICLFVDRARAVNSTFSLTEQNASLVTQICSRLDGIPLAIELAAARIKLLAPEEIAARLDNRFQLLTSGGRTAPPRHQTLQAVMDWSYALLSEHEQMLFRSLAVFSGSWGLEATETVCSASGPLEEIELLDLLSNLVDKSLVIREADQNRKSRYRMLETIRQYAFDALVRSGDLHKMQNHHLRYYLRLVEAAQPHLGFFLTDAETVSWLKVLVPEHDNLRAALKFCEMNPIYVENGLKLAANLHWYCLVHNHLSEGRNWLEKLLAHKNAVSNVVQARAYLTLGFLACWQGDFASARPDLQTSLKLSEELDDRSGVAFSLHGLGFAANGLGEHADAGRYFENCLQTAREINDKWLISIALHFIAVGSSFQGSYELARFQFEDCIKFMKEGYGTAQGIAFSEFHLGRIARIQGDFTSARVHHAEGLNLFARMGDRRGIGYSLFGFACLAQVQQDTNRAARLFGTVDSIREKLGSLLEAVLQFEYEQTKQVTQAALGDEPFIAAWSAGHEVPLEQAIQFALSPK